MSVSVTARVFWTSYTDIYYLEKSGKRINISKHAAKITMLAIGDSADDFGENSYNSLQTLAIKTDLERRSVIRAVRGLVHQGHISVQGLSVYGTNNFKIAMDKLGEPPKKRAKTGRPEASDSKAESGDSGAESGDTQSPDSSLTHPLSVNGEGQKKSVNGRVLGTKPAPQRQKKDPAGWFDETPEQRAAREAMVDVQHRFERASRINPNWSSTGDGWADFTTFLLKKQALGQTIEAWYRWYNKDKFRRDAGAWIKPGMITRMWNQAFPVDDAPEPEIVASVFEQALSQKAH